MNVEVTSQSTVHPFLQGGGQMGELIRNKNWQETSLGDPGCWPQSLRTTISTCLNSRFPILIWWGPDLVMLYNDAYRPILGEKHPASLGEKGKLVWPEIWNIIGPMLNGVYEHGLSTWSENQLLLLNRYGFVEECYFTFSYSPVYDESGGIGGVYCAVTETTKPVLNERQLKTLQDISKPDVSSKTADEVYRAAAKALAKNNKDFPFGIIYKIDDPNGHAVPAAYIGLSEEQTAFPSSVDLTNPADGMFNFCRAFRENEIIISQNNGRRTNIPFGGWDKEATHFVHIPIANAGSDFPNAMLSAALNPYRRFDESYRQFATLIAGQVALEINNVLAFEEERRRSEALAEIDRSKTVFFSNISHEFRTPLTLMLGPLQELISNDESLTPHAREAVSVAYRNTLRLQKLVNTLLDFSRIEAGRMQGVFQPVNICTLTRDIAGTFRSAVERAGLQLIIQCEPMDEPTWVDVDMWERIVLNLVSNAFKYTRQGTIEVALKKDGDNVVLTVSDTGVGIPAEELPKIFERFYRVHHGHGRSQEGTGIGLAMIRELVKLHRGHIEAQSSPGRGSIFTVSLPLGKDHLAAEKLRSAAVQPGVSEQALAFTQEAVKWAEEYDVLQTPDDAGTEKELVLIADDNADMRDYLARLVSGRYQTIVCSDGEQAFQKAVQHKPALIISDVMMPRLDGFALLKKLRTHPSTRNTSVMFLSARAGQEAIVEGLTAGADDYLVKPFAAREFVARVDASIKLAKARRASEKDLFDLLMHAPVGVVVFAGAALQIELVNDLMLEYWQKERQDVVNRELSAIWSAPESRGIAQLLQEVFASGERRFASEVELKSAAGGRDKTYVNFLLEPRVDDHGNVSGVIAVVNNVTAQVTARRQIEELVQQRTREFLESNEALGFANRELQRINANLRDFTYAASHDMKEPLRKINYFSDRILQNLNAGKLDNLDYFTRMKHAVQRMESLIEDLLSYSRLDADPEQMELVDLNALVANVVSDLQPDIDQYHANIEVQLLPQVRGFARQLYQVFENLFSNAIKFRKASHAPVIRVSASRQRGSEMALAGTTPDTLYDRVEVEDEGIGFDSREAARIFNLFTRLHGNAEYEGNGIGLAIVKKVMENHAGLVFAEGLGSKGARFVLLFPSLQP